MKNQNFPILLVVIAVVAVAAQLARNKSSDPDLEALRSDMTVGLSRLWDMPNQQVDLSLSGRQVDARATVSMPATRRMRQKRWNYPFLRFVAAHHPKFQLQNLEVRESGNPHEIPEFAMHGLLAERAYSSPGPGAQEEQYCQMTARQWSVPLDRQFGAGHCLVLVDAQEGRSARPQVYGRRASGAVPYQAPTSFLVNEICLVADREVPADGIDRFQKENPSLMGGIWRVVRLP